MTTLTTLFIANNYATNVDVGDISHIVAMCICIDALSILLLTIILN